MRVPVLFRACRAWQILIRHRNDVLTIAKRLNVVDMAGTSTTSTPGNNGGLDARIRTFAFERFDEAGSSPQIVATRATMNVHLQVVTCAENVFALGKPFGRGLLSRLIQNLRAFRHFATDVDIGELHVIREAGDDHAFDQLMRILVDNLAIFERARLGFVGRCKSDKSACALRSRSSISSRRKKPRRRGRANQRSSLPGEACSCGVCVLCRRPKF